VILVAPNTKRFLMVKSSKLKSVNALTKILWLITFGNYTKPMTTVILNKFSVKKERSTRSGKNNWNFS
jgi:hypothetical protein